MQVLTIGLPASDQVLLDLLRASTLEIGEWSASPNPLPLAPPDIVLGDADNLTVEVISGLRAVWAYSIVVVLSPQEDVERKTDFWKQAQIDALPAP